MITAQRTEGADGIVSLVITVEQEELKNYVREAEKQLANELRLDGFRPGKIPSEVLKAKVGDDRIRQTALEYAIQDSLMQTVSREKLDIADHFDLSVVENSAHKLVYKVSVIKYPDVKNSDYSAFNVQALPIEVAEAEVERVLKDILESRVKFKLVEREARPTDRVEVDFKVTDKGQLIEGGQSENHPLVLGAGNFVPGFEDAIVGLKPGESKNFKLTIPNDYHAETVRGKELDFEVVLKNVSERIVPELNDEFARGLGHSFESAADLKQNIREGLQMEQTTKERDRLRLELLNQVIERAQIKAPERLTERQLDSMLQDLRNDLDNKGLNLDQYLEHIKKTETDLRKEWRERAAQQVRLNAVVRGIAKAEKLAAEEAIIEEQLALALERYVHRDAKGDYDALKNINVAGLRTRIADSLIVEKVFELLEQKAGLKTDNINNSVTD